MIKVTTNAGIIAIQPFTSDIFKITTFYDKEFDFLESKLAVIQHQEVDVKVTEEGNLTEIKTETSKFVIDKQTGLMKFWSVRDNRLLTTVLEPLSNKSGKKTVNFMTEPSDNFYGTGQRGNTVRLNDLTFHNYLRHNYYSREHDHRISQTSICIPMFISSGGWGFMADDFAASMFSFAAPLKYSSESATPISYFLFNGGNTLADALTKYADITGHQELPPFWTLGYTSSSYLYVTGSDTEKAIDRFINSGYPIDGCIIDQFWSGRSENVGNMVWDDELFPEHEKLLEKFKNQHIHTSIIMQPYILESTSMFEELDGSKVLSFAEETDVCKFPTWLGSAGLLDVSSEECNDFLEDRYSSLISEGLSGIWLDQNEPECHPDTILHANGLQSWEYHNLYANDFCEIVYNTFKKNFPDIRPFVLSRAGTAGLQRFSTFTWSGDVQRSWLGFRIQVNNMLSAGISGLGYHSSDLGGFAILADAPLIPDLYVRWLQMGVFTPLFRTHAQYCPEPFNYKEQEDYLKELVKERYKWLPYNYTLAYENSKYGWPLCRVPNFKDSFSQVTDVKDEYLWGDSVLVAPIMEPDTVSRSVLIPEGTWISWYNSNEEYEGPQKIASKTPTFTLGEYDLCEMPIYVKKGSFIPRYDKPISNTAEYLPDELTVLYWPDSHDSYELFEDDFSSVDTIKNENFQILKFEGSKTDKVLSISIVTDGVPVKSLTKREFNFEVFFERTPAQVTANGTAVDFTYKKNIVSFQVQYSNEKTVVELS